MAEGVGLVTRMLDAEFGAVATCLDDQEGLRLCAGIGWNAEVIGHTRLGAEHGTLGGFVLEHRSAVVEDFARFGHFELDLDPALSNHRTVSALVVPIWAQTGVSGILGVYSSVRRLFSPLDVEFVQGVASVIRAAEHPDRWRPGSA
jgi:GAF domain-containing protein